MLRKITTALSALGLVVVGSIAIAPPANAVSGVSYCFKFKNGSAYDRMPTTLQLSADNIDWYPVAYGESDPYGCGAFTIWGGVTNAYARVVAEYHVKGTVCCGSPATWTGTSPLIGLPGEGTADLGTGVIVCVTKTVYACVGF